MIRVGLCQKSPFSDDLKAILNSHSNWIAAEYTPDAMRPSACPALQRVSGRGYDIVIATQYPIDTKSHWILWAADIWTLEAAYLSQTQLRKGLCSSALRGLAFKSRAGLGSYYEYFGGVASVPRGAEVIYPSMMEHGGADLTESEQLRLLFVGNDFTRKGGQAVFATAQALRRSFADVGLTIISNSPLAESLVTDKGSGWATCLPCTRSELLNRHLPDADVFLMPSILESFGLAALEAKLLAVPAVVTDYFALPEIVSHGQDGVCVAIEEFRPFERFRNYTLEAIPKDIHLHLVSGLTTALHGLLEPSLRSHMATTARARWQAIFSSVASCRSWETLVSSALELG